MFGLRLKRDTKFSNFAGETMMFVVTTNENDSPPEGTQKNPFVVYLISKKALEAQRFFGAIDQHVNSGVWVVSEMNDAFRAAYTTRMWWETTFKSPINHFIGELEVFNIETGEAIV